MPQTLVSIIIYNYNYEQFLATAIDSALNQTYSHIEVIVVDDCSTDHSRQLIASYDDRIVPVLHKENGKQGAAFNSGFTNSQGEIIIFLDADDFLYPEAVQQIVDSWKSDISKVHYRLAVVDSDGYPRGYTLPPVSQPLSHGDLAPVVTQQGGYNGVPTSGNAISREALSQVMPIAEAYNTTSDDYLSALIPLFGEVIAIDRPLGAYRIHTSNQWAMYELDSKRFHRFIRHDLQRYEIIQTWGKKLGYTVSDNLLAHSFGDVNARLCSLRLDPAHHPVSSDSRLQLTYLGLRTIWQYSTFSITK